MLPARIRSKMALMLSNLSQLNVVLTCPSAAKASASARSRRVPTMDPRIVRRFNTTSCANALVLTAVTSVPWTPPRCDVTSLTGSTFAVLTDFVGAKGFRQL